jgi:hypothetical protein
MKYLLPKLVSVIVGLGGAVLAGWLLRVEGLNHGRWQSCIMFLPAVLLFFGAIIIRQYGSKGYGVFVLSGLFFLFGIVVLFTG